MKPAKFDYYEPYSMDEAAALLDRYQSDAKVLAGGQSLMPLLNMRLARPGVLVDVNHVAESSYVREWEGGVAIGMTTRQRALQRDPLILARLPLLGEVAQFIGHPQIRSRGTVCGSLAHADPAAELPALATALGAQLVIRGPSGSRTASADEFFVGYLTTSLAANEMLAEARFPASPAGMAWSFREVSRRHGDFAMVGSITGLALDGAARAITAARVVCFGVGGKPVRVRAAEEALLGQAPGDAAFAGAAEIVSREVDPDEDIHASVAYRRSVAGALTRRTLRESLSKLTAGRN